MKQGNIEAVGFNAVGCVFMVCKCGGIHVTARMDLARLSFMRVNECLGQWQLRRFVVGRGLVVLASAHRAEHGRS